MLFTPRHVNYSGIMSAGRYVSFLSDEELADHKLQRVIVKIRLVCLSPSKPSVARATLFPGIREISVEKDSSTLRRPSNRRNGRIRGERRIRIDDLLFEARLDKIVRSECITNLLVSPSFPRVTLRL